MMAEISLAVLVSCVKLLQKYCLKSFFFFFLQYGFNQEKWIVTGKQPFYQVPSCPPYWLMFSSPQVGHRVGRRGSDPCAHSARPRSHSLNSPDTRCLHHRTVKFLVPDSDDEDGDCEDNEGFSTEYARHPIKTRERPRSAAPRDRVSRVKDMHRGSSPHHCKPDSPQGLRAHKGSLSSLQDCRQSLRAQEQHRPQQSSPLPAGQKSSKKKQRPLFTVTRKFSLNTSAVGPSLSRLQQQRPSSAGSVVKNRRQKVCFCV